MIPAALPPDEYDRLADLHDLRLLDNPAQPRFDRVTRLAQRIFGTEIAAFSLVDEDRQYFMSRIGLRATETPRDQSFCAHAILGADVMVVPDAAADPRFHDNPLVTGEPDIRFYAGAPVRSENGHAIGTLCVIDTRPREWTADDSEALADLATLVERELRSSRSQARHQALVALTEISALHSDDSQQLLRDALQVACAYLEMPTGTITRWAGGDTIISVGFSSDGTSIEGQRLPSEFTTTPLFAEPDRVLAVSRLDESPLATHPVRVVAGLECLIGMPLTIDREPVGSLTFTSTRPLLYGEFTEDEIDFVRLLARWVEGILARARQEESLRRRRALLSLIRSAQSTFISTTDRALAFESLLADILDLTGCAYGFIAERLMSPEGRPYMRTRALTNIAWDDATQALYEREHSKGLVFDNPDTLFGVTMVSGEPVIANDPAHDPRSGGIPEHHPSLDAYLGLPLVLGDELVGVMGLANNPDGFSEADVEYLEPLTTTVAQLISVVRTQEKHRADQAIINRLSTVVRQMNSGVVIADLEGRIVWVNAAFELLFQYPLDDVVGLRPRDVFHSPGTDPAVEQAIRDAMARTDGFAADLRVVRRDGERFWVSVASTPLLGDAAEPVGFVVLIDDITERKRAERMKDEFVSTISHELRTPLTSITGSLALVGSGAAGELTERAQRMVGIAQHNAQRLTLLINDLLDLEKLLQGGIPIDAEPHPVMVLVEQSVIDNQAYAARYDVTIVIAEWADDAIVFVDSVRFIQIMANLLSNAAKFSPEGGSILVRVRAEEDTVTVEVADEGPGVPEAFRDRVFERFAQADASDRRAHGGTGLGLAISKELVERMGGVIAYRFTDEDGSVFSFTLPRIHDRRSGGDRRAKRA